MSFITNTNWQNYGGENTLSYFSQMFAIIFPQFTSAARAWRAASPSFAAWAAARTSGNFYVDLTRAITRIMLPIAFVAAHRLRGAGRAGDVRRRAAGQHAERSADAAAATQRRPVDGTADRRQRPPSATAQGQQIDHPRPGGGAGVDQAPGHQRRRLVQRQLRASVRKSQPDQQRPREHPDGAAADGAHLHARHHDQPHEAGLDLLLGHVRLLPGLPGDRLSSARSRAIRC